MTIVHGSLHAFFAVLAGAFGAHGLQHILDDYGMKIWQTAATYHISHALALLLLGLFERQLQARLRFAHSCFGAGILLFSGSLYALALSGVKALGMITPLGGTLFLLGWMGFAWAGWKHRSPA